MITNAADATSSSQQESSVVFLGTRPDRGPDLFQPDGRKLLKFCGAVIGLAIVQVVPLGLAVLATTGSELEEPASPDPGTIIIVAISSPLEIVLLGISLCLSSCCRLHSAIMAALCIMGVASFATGIYALTVAAMSMGNSACDAAVWSERCDGALTMGLAAGIIRAFVACDSLSSFQTL